ncbi:MAG: hypothetical protein NWF07_02765 [Candidatus Bathyarchaeota archaeon]|nr:hypothetical protein [Candidatus Bathyarchaeota archaeon]
MTGHSPTLETILMIEKTIIESEEHLNRRTLWKSLPRQVHYSTFKNVIEYLEASGKIIFNDNSIVYTGVNNAKLEKLIQTSVKI